MHFDVQQIPLPDESFDAVICNHLLEHVDDDRLAMRELYRIMRPGGWGVVLTPVDRERAATFEDPTVTDPAERTRLFGSTTTSAYTAATMPTDCAKRASRSNRRTMPPRSAATRGSYMPWGANRCIS